MVWPPDPGPGKLGKSARMKLTNFRLGFSPFWHCFKASLALGLQSRAITLSGVQFQRKVPKSETLVKSEFGYLAHKASMLFNTSEQRRPMFLESMDLWNQASRESLESNLDQDFAVHWVRPWPANLSQAFVRSNLFRCTTKDQFEFQNFIWKFSLVDKEPEVKTCLPVDFELLTFDLLPLLKYQCASSCTAKHFFKKNQKRCTSAMDQF